MIKIKFDRDSVCMADSMRSHTLSFDVDDKISIDDFIGILYAKYNAIANIGGGRATWILQIKIESSYEDIALFAEQWDSAKCFSNSLFTIEEIIKYYNSTDFYAKYLAQQDPETVYNTMKVEKHILLDPVAEKKENAIEKKYKLFTEFCKEIKKQNLNFETKYKDHKSWVGSILNKKRKICWFSVWNTGFKLTFYFTEKTIEDVYALDINIDLKKVVKEAKPIGKLIPIIIEIEDKNAMKDGLKILEYKLC